MGLDEVLDLWLLSKELFELVIYAVFLDGEVRNAISSSLNVMRQTKQTEYTARNSRSMVDLQCMTWPLNIPALIEGRGFFKGNCADRVVQLGEDGTNC